MQEIWKDIPSFEGYYQFSNLGRVKSLKRTVIRTNGRPLQVKEKILKLRETGIGDLFSVALCKPGQKERYAYIHVLEKQLFGDKREQNV